MCKLGYTYSEVLKTFYTDYHEKKEIFEYRNKFVKRHLLNYEPYMLWWVQVYVSKLKKCYSGDEVAVKVEDENRNNKRFKQDIHDKVYTMGKTYMYTDNKDKIIVSMLTQLWTRYGGSYMDI